MDKLLSTLGLALKAGLLKSGEFSTEAAVKDGSARLVVLARDASANTKKLFHDKCSYRGIPCIEYGDKASLGHATGNEERACAAVLSEGFAGSILRNSDQKEIGDR